MTFDIVLVGRCTRLCDYLVNCAFEMSVYYYYYYLTITVYQRELDIGQKSSFFSYPLAFDAPVRGVPVGTSPPRLVQKKTRMVWLPDGEKISNISLFVLAQLTNVTDARTDGRTDGNRMTAYTALMHMHRAVKTMSSSKVNVLSAANFVQVSLHSHLA